MLQKLSSTALERRTILPEKPCPCTLLGKHIRLEPLVIERDAKQLFEVSNGNAFKLGNRSMNAYDADELIWRYMFDGPFNSVKELTNSLQMQVNSPNGCCMCVFDVSSGLQVGVANFMNNIPSHLKIELGGIWYSPIVQKSSANTEATYLMLKHCFELGYRRVEWKCHSLNERSRKAALRMGFKFEGIQESHMISKNCNRDTAWFRVLENEWPGVKQNLEQLLMFV
jgi:RimJ/RimL family protein N-acetyltransferase